MAIIPYRYYVDADPKLNRLDLFECVLQIDDQPAQCYLITTFIKTDNGIEEIYTLDLPPRCILTSQKIANIVMQVLPHYFTYDLSAIPRLYMCSLQSLNDDVCPYDLRLRLGRVVLANRILESFNQSFIGHTKIMVREMERGCRNVVKDLRDLWRKHGILCNGEVEKLRNDIIQYHINPLMMKFMEYLDYVPCNRLTELIRQASQQLDYIRQRVQKLENISHLCKVLVQTLSTDHSKFPEYRIISQQASC